MEAMKESARNLDNPKNPLKTVQVGLTPSTVSTSRPTSLASDWTPATAGIASSSISTSRGNENNTASISLGTEKNTKDILAQWRLEREQGRNKLGDIMSLENSRNNEGQTKEGRKIISLRTKAVAKSSSVFSIQTVSKSGDNASNDKKPSQRAPLGGAANDDFLDAIIHNHLSEDLDVSSAFTGNTNATINTHTQPKDGNSITTTPTANTALNSMGIDRLSNRNEGSLGVTSLNVRLFRPIQEDNEAPKSLHENSGMDESLEEDVSLITQDTELQNIMRPLDADRMMEAIEKEQMFRNGHRHLHRQSTSTLHSKGVQEALSSLQSSLERSRGVRNEQDQELLQQKEVIERLQRENAVLMNDHRKDKSVFTNSVKTLFEEVHKIDAMLCGDEYSQNSVSSYFSKDLNSMEGILDVVKGLAKSSIPILLDKMEENKQSAADTQKCLEQYSGQLNDIKSQISRQERDWEEKQRSLSDQLESKENDLVRVQSDLEKNTAQLQDTSSLLEKKLEDAIKADAELTNINIELGEKRVELTEINRLCEDRIQSAYTMECSAQGRLEAADGREMEINSLHDAAIKKHDDAKAAEKVLGVKREEMESDRLAWEAQLQLRSEQLVHEARSLKEQEEEMRSMTASMESERSGFESECDRMNTVQNALLEKEFQIAEREQLVDEKEAAIKAQTEQHDIRTAAVAEAKFQVENDINQFKADKTASAEDLERRDLSLSQQQNEIDDERDQCLGRLQALEESETQLRMDRKEFSGKVTKFKNAVKAAKAEAERKKSELKKVETELGQKEAALAKDTKRFAQDRTDFDKVKEECNAKEAELLSISKKCRDAAKSLKKMKIEMSNEREVLRKKVELARAEYNGLVESCTKKRKEFESLAQKEQVIQESVIAGERAREEMMQAIEVKEFLLTKIELNIDAERNDWEKKIAKERAEVEAEKEMSKKKARKYYAEAKAKMTKKSLAIHSTHKAAKDELDAKAQQIEALHDQLQKLKKTLDLKNEDLSKREATLRKTGSTSKEITDKLDAALSEKDTLLEKLEKKENAIEKFESATMIEFESTRVEKVKLERQLVAKDQALKKFQSLTKDHESLLTERNELEASLFDKESALESMQQTVRIKDSVLDKLQDRLKETDSAMVRLEEAAKEYESLHIENSDLQDRLAKVESEANGVLARKRDYLKLEKDFDSERDRFMERVRAIEEAETRVANLDERERRISNEYEALTQLTNLLEQDKKESEQRTKEISQLESDLQLRRDSLVTQETDISKEKVLLEEERRNFDSKSKRLKKLEGELRGKLSNVALSEKKLKDYAKMMKKQTKDLKEKEKSLANHAKILSEKEDAMDNYSASITELQELLDEERNRYKLLLERCEKHEVMISKSSSIFESLNGGQDGAVEDRIQQMALRIKEKDNELTRKQIVLEDKLAKCDECEARLATWQQELEGFAAAMGSSGGDVE